MSWRNAANVTGTNEVPLANRRRFGPALDSSPAPPHGGPPIDERGRSETKSATPDGKHC